MKTIKYTFVLLSLLLAGCTKDFLEVENTQLLFRESYVKDLGTTEEYVRGIYYHLTSLVEAGEINSSYGEVVSDNLRPVSATSSIVNPQYNWVQNAASANMDALWRNCYLAIRQCSFVAESIDAYRWQNPALADDLKGQALAIRAYLHFKLVNVFAQPYGFSAGGGHPGVPYITFSDITRPYSRQTVSEVYSEMEQDLKNAIELLPAATRDTRLMNRNAARALLARVYLFMDNYSGAKALSSQVIASVPLMSISAGYPNDMFRFRAPNATESLFQVTPAELTGPLGRWVRRTAVRLTATSDVALMLGDYQNDVRKAWVKDTVISAVAYKAVKKFPQGATPEFPRITTLDIAYYTPVLRSSEMYLTYAEAAAKTGEEAQARTMLNLLRKRANPVIADVGASGAALLDSIYKERRKELAFEGLRLFDLQRWKMGVTRSDAVPGFSRQMAYPSNQLVSPIPLDEVRLNGMAQNQGY